MIDYHYFFLIGSVLVAAVSQVLLKKGALHHYDSWIRENICLYMRMRGAHIFLTQRIFA